MLERLNEELRRRTRVVRIFPNAASCLRLTRALCAETREAWLEDNRCIKMDLLREQRKERMRKAAGPSGRDRQFAQLDVCDRPAKSNEHYSKVTDM